MSLRAALTADLPLKLTSLALSLFLWLLAAGEEPVSALMTVDLTVQAPAGRTLLHPPGAVRALVVGPRRELLKLSATPVRLTRVLPDSVEGDEVRLDLAPGEIELPRGITARVQDVQPHALTIALDEGRVDLPMPRFSGLWIVGQKRRAGSSALGDAGRDRAS